MVSRAYAAAAASAASLVRSGPGLTSAFELSEMGWSFHVVGYEPDMERGLSVEDMLAAAGGDTGMFMLDYGIASKLLGGGSPDIELIRSVRKLRTVLRDSEDAMGVWQGQQFRLGREVVMQTAAELFRNHLEIIRKRMRTFGIGLVRETASAEIGGYTALPGVINIYCGEPMTRRAARSMTLFTVPRSSACTGASPALRHSPTGSRARSFSVLRLHRATAPFREGWPRGACRSR